MIKTINNRIRYFDKNKKEITEGCKIKFADGRIEKVYLTTKGELGIDATNPKWIENGIAVECEFGIYPLTKQETDEVEVVE